MKKMYIKWPAYIDGAGISRELEESEHIKKLADLPRREARREFCNTGGWDKPYRDHSFWNTDECCKARAIIHASVNSSIQKVRAKLKPLIPAHEGLENFLDDYYDKEREDGKLIGYNGHISDKPDNNFRPWRSREKWYNIEGLIKGASKRKPQHHLTKEEIIARQASKLEARAKILAIRAEDKRYADFYAKFINLPKDLLETKASDRWPYDFTYWRLLRYIHNIDKVEYSSHTYFYSKKKYYGPSIRIKETDLDRISLETVLEKMEEIEQTYFELTGKRYKQGIKIK